MRGGSIILFDKIIRLQPGGEYVVQLFFPTETYTSTGLFTFSRGDNDEKLLSMCKDMCSFLSSGVGIMIII